jgi:hypothetical protein
MQPITHCWPPVTVAGGLQWVLDMQYIIDADLPRPIAFTDRTGYPLGPNVRPEHHRLGPNVRTDPPQPGPLILGYNHPVLATGMLGGRR